MSVNEELLDTAVEWAKEESVKPNGRWYQDMWMLKSNTCGTSYCIAGYVGAITDERYVVSVVVDGIHVADWAAYRLGLTDSPHDDYGTSFAASTLFSASNDIHEIELVVKRIKAGEFDD